MSLRRHFVRLMTLYCLCGCMVNAGITWFQSTARAATTTALPPILHPTIELNNKLGFGQKIPCNKVGAVQQTNATASNSLSSSTVLATNSDPLLPDTNLLMHPEEILVQNFDTRLAMARYFEKTRQPEKAQPILKSLLAEGVPDSIRQSALLEMATVAGTENALARAETIYSQFLDRWPNDPRVPEILLREGQLFRQMGLNKLALAKFYAVMTAALSLKNDQLTYYQHLVLQAQVEIAGTHYEAGQFADAADFYSRLLKQDDPALDRPQTQYRLIRSLTAVGQNEEAAGQAREFLSDYTNAPQQAEVRYYLAQALKQMGQNGDALQQVLLLLQEEKVKTRDHPEIWTYWQQRAGNEIANQLYREGDYVKALDIYINLAQLDPKPSWQLPVQYQIGITYEKLLQPEKAIETYNAILQRQPELGTNMTPGLQAVCDMARWRAGFLKWQNSAEQQARALAPLSKGDYTMGRPGSPATNSISNIP